MKLLDKEPIVAPRARALMPNAVVRTETLPSISVRARVVRRPKAIPLSATEVLNGIVAFAAIFGVVYVGSTLLGYVGLERARQTARHGADRAAFARSQAEAARASIEALTSPNALGAWATTHGFAPAAPITLSKPGSVLVAQR